MEKFISQFTTAVTLCLLPISAFAGTPTVVGSITFATNNSAPPPGITATPVPTLSGIMLMVLALLLATIAYRILKQKGNNTSRTMFLSLIAVGALVSGINGVKLINDAYAIIPSYFIDVGGPSTRDLREFSNTYTNVDTSSLFISEVLVSEPYGCFGGCSVDTVLFPGDSCEVSCLPPL